MTVSANPEFIEDLEFAFIVAAELIAGMDASMRGGTVTVVPEDIIWAMQESCSDYMHEVERKGYLDYLSVLLTGYASLRTTALRQIAQSTCSQQTQTLESALCLKLENLIEALASQNWTDKHALSRAVFAAALPILKRRFELTERIDWGNGDEDASQGDEQIDEIQSNGED